MYDKITIVRARIQRIKKVKRLEHFDVDCD